jgi:hypothetical protein
MMGDPRSMQRHGQRNRAHARKHHDRLQAAIRRKFLDAVRAASAGGFREARCA